MDCSRWALTAYAATACATAQVWTAVPLHPSGAQYSIASAVGASEQVGAAQFPFPGDLTPVVWNSSSATWAPLAIPAGGYGAIASTDMDTHVGMVNGQAALWRAPFYEYLNLWPGGSPSQAHAVRAGMQVGSIGEPGSAHATLWFGTAASRVDLHPATAIRSTAFATDGIQQGGEAWFPIPWAGGPTWRRAILWNGSSGGYIDLNPLRTLESTVRGMAPGIQVGWIQGPGAARASIWNGTAASWRELHSPSWGSSRLFATTGTIHVGQGGSAGLARAIANFGSPETWVELHQFLPPGYTGFSAANAVYEENGRVFVVGYADSPLSGAPQAFMWVGAVPCWPNCDQSTMAPVLNVADFGCFVQRFAAGDTYANCDQSTAIPTINVADFTCFVRLFAAGCP